MFSRNTSGARLVWSLMVFLLAACAPQPPSPSTRADPPPAPREFRAAWVATVTNIDWPSKPGLTVARQQAEIIAILNRARALKLNAIILQVRPSADALYASALEPWSEYLTGVQGCAPAPFYDPLALWIAEAHRRGLELHAWFNPYRARHQEAQSDFAPTHLAKTHPTSVKKYGELWWMDPGDAFASQRTLDVVADVVRRYDVDGVHIDDYFYPYPIAAARPDGTRATLDFPDEPSWQLYRAGGGRLARPDWRRQNVDRLVEQLSTTIHRLKPWVKFGISPFGLGRPDLRPPGVTGFSQYDQLYANVELWLRNGWLDYLAPQLYWPTGRQSRPFAVLLDYWAKQNTAKRHLWPGLFTSSLGDGPKAWAPAEILRQIDLVRANPNASGHIHFSMAALFQDRRGIVEKLSVGPYTGDALVPATLWLGATLPTAPWFRRLDDGHLALQVALGASAAHFAIWQRQGGVWYFFVQPATATALDVRGVETITFSAVDRLGNESRRVTLQLSRQPAQKP